MRSVVTENPEARHDLVAMADEALREREFVGEGWFDLRSMRLRDPLARDFLPFAGHALSSERPDLIADIVLLFLART